MLIRRVSASERRFWDTARSARRVAVSGSGFGFGLWVERVLAGGVSVGAAVLAVLALLGMVAGDDDCCC